MAAITNSNPEIVLYDLACTKNECFSPAVWRTRLVLNYKRIPYKTIFLELQDIGPTLERLGVEPTEVASWGESLRTVPVIHHVRTNKYITDSTPIAEFLESAYPSPAVPLSSPLGDEVIAKIKTTLYPILKTSILAPEINLFSPRAQEYFRATREKSLGHPLEDLLDQKKQAEAWSAVETDLRALDALMRTNHARGPFVLGAETSYADFVVIGWLQFIRVVDEQVFQRLVEYPGFGQIYQACLPYMEKRD